MAKRLAFELKQRMVALTGACFWYWNNFYSFLDSCGVPRSLYQRFPKESFNKYDAMRNILTHLEETGNADILNNVVSSFYRLKNAVDRDNLDEAKAKALLQEFRQQVGNDPIDRELERREQQKRRQQAQSRAKEVQGFRDELAKVNSEFLVLCRLIDLTPQERGFRLERLFFELLRINEFEFTRPYRTGGGEQIDGHFRFDKFDYLVEAKWEKDPVKQADVSIFDGKIRGKAQSTRGFFLSMSAFDENAITKFSGDSPRIIFMGGEDFALILDGSHLLFDAIKAKVDALVRYGRVYLPLREL
jgi:restriction endonuclease Mrr